MSTLENTRTDLSVVAAVHTNGDAQHITLQSLLLSIPDLIFKINSKGELLDYKSRTKDFSALCPNRFLGRSISEIWPPEIAVTHLEYIRKAIQTNEVNIYEYPMKDANNQKRYFESRLHAISSFEVLAVIREITHHVETGQRLQLLNTRLKEQYNNIEYLLKHAPDSVIMINEESTITYWNDKSEAIFGWKSSEAVGQSLSATILPAHMRHAHLKGMERYKTTGTAKMLNKAVEIPAVHKSGMEFYISMTISQATVNGNRVFIAFSRDITEKIKSRALIQKRDRQLIEAQSIARLASYEWNTVTNKVEWSDEFYRLLDISKNEHDGDLDYFFPFIHPDDREKVLKKLNQSKQCGSVAAIEFRIITATGQLKYVRLNSETDKNAGDNCGVLFGTLQDVTDQRLYQYHLFKTVTESEEKERNRIAAELHDGVNPQLAAIKLIIDTALRQMKSAPEMAENFLNRSKELLDETINMTRKVSHELMPSSLTLAGLIPSVVQMVNELNQIDTTRYHLSIKGAEQQLEQSMAVNLYRIIQEFIRNSQKHAEAKNVYIEIVQETSRFYLCLIDDGKGFNSKQIKGLGVGMISMKNRIKSIGGQYDYKSRPNEGVTLSVEVPV